MVERHWSEERKKLKKVAREYVKSCRNAEIDYGWMAREYVKGYRNAEIDFGWMAKSGGTPLGFVEAVWLDVAMDGDGSPSTEQL